MTTGGGDPSSKDTADTLLRAIAAAPARPLEAVPERVAHFRILERLGQGGMGVVYRAEDETLRRTVALKLLPDASGNEERRQRFLREARSAAAITHPNVAVVHQVGEADGRIYIAMELVLGENLRARLDRGRLDVETARELAGQIARGLSAAHDKGIVHRDLKPENVMITPAGLVKLLDFGLAKPGVDRGPSSGPTEVGLAKTETVVTSDERRLMGTPEYMSPEQALGEALDVRSDVFSFGILLYEMLAGARPFGGASTGAVLVAIARDAAPPLRERAPAVDEVTEAIVARCLAKAPEERFANAGEIVAALGGQRTSGPTVQSRADVEPITRNGTMRARPRRSVVAVGIVAAALGCALAWWVGPHARSRAAVDSSGAASLDSGAQRRGIAITDHPPPKTSVPEAAASYASALGKLRGASILAALDDLERSIKLDPTLAPAHIRAALNYAPSETSRREHLVAAEQLRGTLDDRDRMILSAVEASLLPGQGNQDETLRRFGELVRRFPEDAEAAWLFGMELDGDGRFDEARREFLRALDLDPEFAEPLHWLGMTYGNEETSFDPDQAIALFTRCLAIAPSAGSCLRSRAAVYVRQGRCDDLMSDARTMAVVVPNDAATYLYLAGALAAENAPREAIEEALHKSESLAHDPEAQATATVQNARRIALLSGDLVSAESAARRAVALAEGTLTEWEHGEPTLALMDVLEERGDKDGALAEAEAFERRAQAWTQDSPWAVRLRLAFARHAAGRIDRAALDTKLDALQREGVSTPRTAMGWAALLGDLASTSSDATRALSCFTDAGAISYPPAWRFPRRIGHALLVAGRPREAVTALRMATSACTALDFVDTEDGTIEWMRAHVLLGQALEQTGDVPGACAAYAVVMDRWRNAKPRSITLEKAKERSRALACSKL